jgi:hypothetical protein
MIVSPMFLSGQTKFEPGYIISIDGIRKDCFIRNAGMEGKGEGYYYKINKKDKPQKVEVEQIKEFGIEGELRFVRTFIEVDVSGDRIKQYKDTLNHEDIEKGYAYLTHCVYSELASLYSFFNEWKLFYFYLICN